MDPFQSLFKGSKNIEPSKSFVKSAKNRLMNRIQSEAETSFLQKYFTKTKNAEPSISFIQQSKIRLMYRIQADLSAAKWRILFSWFKRVTASMVVMVMLATITLFGTYDGKIVEAYQADTLTLLEGQVYIRYANENEGRTISSEASSPEAEFSIEPGSFIATNNEGMVSLEFGGGSKVILDKNTSLFVVNNTSDSRYSNQDIAQENTSNLFLVEGRIWGQALNVKQPAIEVETDNMVVSSVKSSFALEANSDQEPQVIVFNSKLHLVSSETEYTTTILPNQKAVLEPEGMVSLSDLTEEEKSDSWIRSMRAADKEYLNELSSERVQWLLENVGALPGNDVSYFLKRASENANRNITSLFGDADNDDLIYQARSRFNEAIAIALNKSEENLSEEEQVQIQDLLSEFRSILDQLKEQAKASGNEEEVVEKVIIPSKRLVSTLSSNINLNPIKETLNETEESLLADAQNPEKFQEIQKENDLDRLRDVETLIAEGELEEAERILNHYLSIRDQRNISGSIDLNQQGNEIDENKLQKELDLKREEFALIDNIKAQLEDQNIPNAQLVSIISQAQQITSSDLDEVLSLAKIDSDDALVQLPETSNVLTPRLQELTRETIADISFYGTFQSKKRIVDNALITLEREGGLSGASLEENGEFLEALIDELRSNSEGVMNERLINSLEIDLLVIKRNQFESNSANQVSDEAIELDDESEEVKSDSQQEENSDFENTNESSIEDSNVDEVMDETLEEKEKTFESELAEDQEDVQSTGSVPEKSINSDLE